MSHTFDSCPLTKLDGSLSRLHSADDDVVQWLVNLEPCEPAHDRQKPVCWRWHCDAAVSVFRRQCPPVAVAIAKMRESGEFEKVTNKIDFNIVQLSDLMGWDSAPVKKELKLLEWNLGRYQLSLAGVPTTPDSTLTVRKKRTILSFGDLTLLVGLSSL